MKKILGLMIIGLMVITMSCDLFGPDEAGDIFIEITPSTSGYVWESEIDIIVTAENDGDVSYVKFYLDGEEIYEDALAPYSKTISTNQWEYGEHIIKVKAVYSDDSKTEKTTEVSFVCCPIYEEDLVNINGITETDAVGELIPDGNIDSSDWHFGDGVVGTTFGPAFPNACETGCTIPFYLDVLSEVSIIIINSDNEVVEVLRDNALMSSGLKNVQWDAPSNTNAIYRAIFHTDDGSHWRGDVEVQ